MMSPTTLSDQLDQIEAQLGRVGFGLGKQALGILPLLDAAAERLRKLKEQGIEPRAEIAQFETIESIFKKQAGAFLREIGGKKILHLERAKINPDSTAWWWFIDEHIVKSQRASLLRGLKRLGLAAGVLLIVAILYQLFFQPDPQVIASMEAEQNAQQSFEYGNLDQALGFLDEGLAISVNDPDLLVMKGVLLEQQQKTNEAEIVYLQAKKIIGDEEQFYLYLCQTHMRFRLFEMAIMDAEQVISINPESARGYLLKGQALEQKGDLNNAYLAYQEASRLGEVTRDDATTAQARILMGYLLQAMAQPFSQDSQITSTPIP